LVSSRIEGWVKPIVLINNTEIRPAHTDNSKTAAKGADSLNISTATTALVKASAIAARNKLLVITVHNAAIIMIISIAISTLLS